MSKKLLVIPLILITMIFGYFFTQDRSCGAVCGTQTDSVNAAQFHDLISQGSSVLLDVRTKQEYASGHIASAINLDFNDQSFPAQLSLLDKTKNYLVYCRSGNRSSQAIKIMQQSGFSGIVDLEGGIQSWQASNLPITQ